MNQLPTATKTSSSPSDQRDRVAEIKQLILNSPNPAQATLQLQADIYTYKADGHFTCEAARVTTVDVRGETITVACPSWCTTSHPSEPVAFLEDVCHSSDSITLPVARYGGGTEELLSARLSQYPFVEREEERRPVVALDLVGDGETVEYSAAQSGEFARKLAAHGQALIDLAQQLGESKA